MENLTINVVSYKLVDLPSHQNELDDLNAQNDKYEYQDFSSIENLIKYSNENENAFYIFNIKSKADYVLILKHLRLLNRKKVIFKSICFFDFENEKAVSSLYKLGVTNVLNTSSTTKNFIIKVNMALRSFENNISEDGKSLDYKKMDQRADEFLDGPANSKNSSEANEKVLHPTKFGVGESSAFNNQKEISDSKFKDSISEPDEVRLMEYIDDLGMKGKLNIQQGKLEIKLGSSSITKCTFESFFEESIILGIEGPIDFKENENISIFVKFRYEKCKVEIELDGIVLDIERFDTNSRYITFSLGEFGIEKREYFMSLYEMRQKSINEFMMLARGIA
jgi:hypothetical protein